MNASNTSLKTEKREYWASHVRQWATSGDTQRDYCLQHQLKLHQLVYWKRVLTDSPENRQTPNASANGFVAVQLTGQANSNAAHLTVELPNGVCIKGVHANNLSVIQEILRWQS